MSACFAVQSTPANSLIDKLLIRGAKQGVPRLGIKAKKLLGGRFFHENTSFENDAEYWEPLLNLGVELGVDSALITPILSKSANQTNGDAFSNALTQAIMDSLAPYKALLKSQFPLTEKSLDFADEFCGDLSVNNTLTELNKKPYLILNIDWIIECYIDLNNSPSDELRNAIISLINAFTYQGSITSTTDLLMQDYFHSSFYENLGNSTNLLRDIELDNWTDKDARQFIKKNTPDNLNDLLEEFGFDSLEEIELLECLASAKECAEVELMERDIEPAKKRVLEFINDTTEIGQKLSKLLPLINFNSNLCNAIDDDVEGYHSYYSCRVVDYAMPSSQYSNSMAQHMMETGESAILAFKVGDTDSLLSTLKHIYLLSYVLASLSEIFQKQAH